MPTKKSPRKTVKALAKRPAKRAKKPIMKVPPSLVLTRKKIGSVAPKLLAYTEDLIFNELWEGKELSKRDRSLVTITALVALYRTGQLEGNIERGLNNGLTKDEIIATITHLAFYSGWPTAMEATKIAADVFARKK